MIDDMREVERLLRDIEAQLPMRARSTPHLLEKLQQNGMSLRPDEEIYVVSVIYLDDVGGIACGLKWPGSGATAVVTSLTHLRVDDPQPLAERIRAYQARRSRAIASGKGHVQAASIDPQQRRKERKKLRKRRG